MNANQTALLNSSSGEEAASPGALEPGTHTTPSGGIDNQTISSDQRENDTATTQQRETSTKVVLAEGRLQNKTNNASGLCQLQVLRTECLDDWARPLIIIGAVAGAFPACCVLFCIYSAFKACCQTYCCTGRKRVLGKTNRVDSVAIVVSSYEDGHVLSQWPWPDDFTR